ncbi:peptide chain release factor-like protein [Thermophilibacter provencensis]|uniref:Peptide chain release factor-like protein n=1 Tax=Thermophilibacter provencensis TaxID=1852386 RepID=A0ABT7V3B6_9ACTN|nr:peptide chain release factor-like protein [Thermophilibacter provencensis]MDM8270516.1 peptide chain release factor-like protein [Thermophilibacter provencensis]
MDVGRLTYREYAAFARMSSEELARDCEMQAFRASGPGGQGVNTTDSAVRVRHVPTGIVVVSREERSQLRNRERCIEKIREICRRRGRPPRPRKKTRVSAAQKRRRLEAKRARGQLKQLRRRVDGE